MKKDNALRYLLLRHIYKFRNLVPKDSFLEITSSLFVLSDTNTYKVKWTVGNKECEVELPSEDFVFYKRGDINPDARNVEEDLGTNNDAKAKDAVINILNLSPNSNPEEPSGKIKPLYVESFLLGLSILIGMLLGGISPILIICIIFLLIIEQFKAGKIFIPVCLVFLSTTSLTGGCLIMGFAYGVLQFLDSDLSYRNLRIGLSAIVCILSLYWITIHSIEITPLLGLIFLVFAVIISFWRMLYLSHSRFFNLSLPFFISGLAFTGFSIAAMWSMVFLFISMFSWVNILSIQNLYSRN